jgi:colanic acid biosynthesis protein WcaH
MIHKATPKEEYLTVIKNTQLIAFDLIIINEYNQVLLGYRNNEPAKNTWFTFGSRVFKNETFEEACIRVSTTEIGTKINYKDCERKGIYVHNYHNNFDNDNFGTNYIVFAHIYKCNKNDIKINGDNQHSNYLWFDIDNILISDNVHNYVKEYFKKNPSNII